MTSPPKQRLDQLLVARKLASSRERARALIREGSVLVSGLPATKPGTMVADTSSVTLKAADFPYVSRGGLKLEKALATFAIDPQDAVCLDVGASTGGFSDCLLQHGAAKVYAVDVGYGQLAWKLRQDARVVVIERTNARHISADIIPEKVDLITVDVSFISLRLIVPAVLPLMKPSAGLVALVKPQFEVGKGQVGKGGVVKDAQMHQEVLASLKAFFTTLPLVYRGHVPSPILGPKGNKEFLAFLLKSPAAAA
ncbi:MAG TPA: TlyA family RNA methyltransferase [Desulfosarcina sp.]|nr:TlyA family RNA methyltransferase [Desulfosarcina sp.]